MNQTENLLTLFGKLKDNQVLKIWSDDPYYIYVRITQRVLDDLGDLVEINAQVCLDKGALSSVQFDMVSQKVDELLLDLECKQ